MFAEAAAPGHVDLWRYSRPIPHFVPRSEFQLKIRFVNWKIESF